MLAGHFGLAAIVKSRQPQVPLWALMLSTQLLDVIFVVLYLMGIERLDPIQGTTGGYGNFFITADYTHSLVGALGISLVAALMAMIPWGRRSGAIIGVMVFSHWLLDLLVHRADMPILPGNSGGLPRLGLGLWQLPWVSAAMELVLLVIGAFLYYHAAMRTAIKAERLEAKAGGTPRSFRSQAIVASVALFLFLVGTLAADFLGLG
ncbi:MAG TPA: permease [Chloroflexia bacterium]|nr:permease [Chloroflexia bacterium]